MLATTFGWYGAFGAATLFAGILFLESGIRWTLNRFGTPGALAVAAPLVLLGWSFVEYGRPWTLHHFGKVGFIIGSVLVATPAALFLRHYLAYLWARFGKK